MFAQCAISSRRCGKDLTPKQWLESEAGAMLKMGLIHQTEEIEPQLRTAVSQMNGGSNDYFIPENLQRPQLMEIAGKLGIKLNPCSSDEGESIPTQAGVLTCNLGSIMKFGQDQWPIILNLQEGSDEPIKLGDDSLTSVEETLYLVIRHFLEFNNSTLALCGWIRCRNIYNESRLSLMVGFFPGDGLQVNYNLQSLRVWGYGSITRQFTPITH